ncbi:STAS domain-containing protein [Mycobacterium sp. pUA109]|uniref:STAS domain-containing protein n=1 Tax=Mycobacterium sp. pUA109 TaxID=3238982 RepID=UPI00351B6746
MTRPASHLTVSADTAGPTCLLTVNGVLDSTTYLRLRDAIIKAALDEPPAVLVDIAALKVPALSALSVFTSARWHVSTWPDIPIILVCPPSAVSDAIARNGIARYVPVFPTVHAALQGVATGAAPGRRRARAELPPTLSSLRRSRELVAEWLQAWSDDHLIPVAKVIVDVLVENVLHHTDSSPVVVAETAGSTVTIAVQDASSTAAVRREVPAGGVAHASGLAVVAALSCAWGSTPTPTGKTVWAVIGPESPL